MSGSPEKQTTEIPEFLKKTEVQSPPMPEMFMKGAPVHSRIFEWEKLFKRNYALQTRKNAQLTDYNEKKEALVQRFYQNTCSTSEQVLKLYAELDQNWRQIAYNANRLYKHLKLKADAFKTAIDHNHYILVILDKEPRLKANLLDLLSDEELRELSENDDLLKCYTKEYLQTQKFRNKIKKAYALSNKKN
ncbi:MAG: hypothetical protein V4608_03230 [Bacteroidota bacterium]